MRMISTNLIQQIHPTNLEHLNSLRRQTSSGITYLRSIKLKCRRICFKRNGSLRCRHLMTSLITGITERVQEEFQTLMSMCLSLTRSCQDLSLEITLRKIKLARTSLSRQKTNKMCLYLIIQILCSQLHSAQLLTTQTIREPLMPMARTKIQNYGGICHTG
jgi:hypothetical protein